MIPPDATLMFKPLRPTNSMLFMLLLLTYICSCMGGTCSSKRSRKGGKQHAKSLARVMAHGKNCTQSDRTRYKNLVRHPTPSKPLFKNATGSSDKSQVMYCETPSIIYC